MENTRTIRHRGLEVEVHTSTQYATVYRKDGTIAGTLSHRRHNERTAKRWSVATTDGTVVHSSDMVTACLSALAIRLVERAEKAAAKAEADRVAAAKAAANNEPSLDELADKLVALKGNDQCELYDAATKDWSWSQIRELDAACERAWRRQAVADALPFAVHFRRPADGKDTGRISCLLADRASAQLWIEDALKVGVFKAEEMHIVDYRPTVAELTRQIEAARKAEDWPLVEKLHDQRRCAEVEADEAQLRD